MHSDRLQYVHITPIKTAGSAIRAASGIAVHPNEELWPRRWLLRYYPQTAAYYWAANVRHPALRAISQHRFARRARRLHGEDFDRDALLGTLRSFNPALPPLHNVIGDPDDYDAILRVETLSADWEPVASVHGLPDLQPMNTAMAPASTFVDDEVLDAAWTRYREDYDVFGYDREPPVEPALPPGLPKVIGIGGPQLRHLWAELHGKATGSPEWLEAWLDRLPEGCPCRAHADRLLKIHPPRWDDFLIWGYEFHDLVNLTLGKPLFYGLPKGLQRKVVDLPPLEPSAPTCSTCS